jgi:hypothetical protein
MSSASFWEKGKEEEEKKKNSRTKPKGALSQVLFSFLAPAPVLHTTHSALALYTLVVHYTHTHTQPSVRSNTHTEIQRNNSTWLRSNMGPRKRRSSSAFLSVHFPCGREKKDPSSSSSSWVGKKNWQCRDKKKKEEETLLFLSK